MLVKKAKKKKKESALTQWACWNSQNALLFVCAWGKSESQKENTFFWGGGKITPVAVEGGQIVLNVLVKARVLCH